MLFHKTPLGEKNGEANSSSRKSIYLFVSTGQSSEAKPQTPSQTKVENNNTVRTPEENGNLGKVRQKPRGRVVSEEGTAIDRTNTPLML